MGVEGGVPLLAVVGPGDVAQQGPASVPAGFLDHVLLGAHSPFSSRRKIIKHLKFTGSLPLYNSCFYDAIAENTFAPAGRFVRNAGTTGVSIPAI